MNFRKSGLFFFLLFSFGISFAQLIPADRYFYDKDLLNADFHQKRREELRKLMPENSVAVFFSNPIRNRANDVDFEFHQDPNFYYLTGFKEPNAILMIFKKESQVDTFITNEVIFVPARKPSDELWNGRRLGVEGVKEYLAIEDVYPNQTFAEMNIDFSTFKKVLYITPNDDVRDNSKDRGDLFSLVKHFRFKAEGYLTTEASLELTEYMAKLREIKQQEELTLMMQAIDFTCEAQKELIRKIRPEMSEYQAEAIIEYVFKKNGSEHPGFPSILGGGENACILHYTSNRKVLKQGDMLVCDIGAEYHGYTADVTRTIPVDGKYTEEQKIIYNIVLDAQNAGIAAAKQGNKFWDPGKASKEVIVRRLTEIGLIKTPDEVVKYMPHGVSHYLGLDVHDAGLFGSLTKGNVITVEPGIYVPEGSPCDPKWWNIGVRIEDDVLITDGQPEILSSCVPKTIEEIEQLMKQNSSLFKN